MARTKRPPVRTQAAAQKEYDETANAMNECKSCARADACCAISCGQYITLRDRLAILRAEVNAIKQTAADARLRRKEKLRAVELAAATAARREADAAAGGAS